MGEVGEVINGGRRPVGRPRKMLSECVMEDMNLLGVEKHVVQNRHMWRAVNTCSTPS